MSQSNYNPGYSILRESYEQTKPEADAIPDGDLLTVTTDVIAAANTGQGVYPKVVALRPTVVQELPGFKISRLDSLKTYAQALLYSQGQYRTATDPPAAVTEMADRVVHTRTVLLTNINSLIAHGVLGPEVINDLQGVNGYNNVTADVVTLVAIHTKHADAIAERTSIKPEELKAAEDLAAAFSEALGLREQSPQVVAAVTRSRRASYTLFVTSYNEVRSAVQYLRRHEGDADTIIPSLFAIHGARKKSTTEGDAPDAPTPTPVVNPPAPTPAGTGSAPATTIISSDHGPFVK